MSTPEAEIEIDDVMDAMGEDDAPQTDDDSVMSDLLAVQAELAEEQGEVDPEPAQKAPEPKAESDDDEIDLGDEPPIASDWEYGDIGKDLGIENERAAANQYVQAVVTLHQQPMDGLAALSDTYLQDKSQAQELIAHIAAKHGIDVFDVDVDEYQQQAPMRQARQRESAAEARLMQMEIQMAQQSGQAPLLNDPAVIREIQQYRAYRPSATLLDAYNVAVYGNPGLSAKHQQAVSGNKSDQETKPKPRMRRATAGDLPRGKPGTAARLDSGPGLSIDEEIREIATEVGYNL